MGRNKAIEKQRVIDKLHEESKAFETGAASLDAAGWAEFMATSKHSAHSEHDKQRQTDLDDAIDEARSTDITIQDFFGEKVAENDGSPSLRDLAKEHWAGIKGPVHAAQKGETAQHSQAGHQQNPKPVTGLRSLLM